MKKILVTGSSGFIGSHLAEALVRKNYKVRALVHYNSFRNIGNLNFVNKNILKEMEIVFGNVEDFNFMKKISKGTDVIMHLAALIGIPYSYEAVSSYINTNIIGAENILQAALENNVGQVIHTSTSEVYGSAEYIPIDEKHPQKAQSPYSATKIAADKLAESYWRSFGLPVSIIRPFNTYGPRQSARAIIPTIIMQIIHKVPRVFIGSDFPIRDFTYVDDTIRAFISIIGNKKSIGQAINVGFGKGISIKELSGIICNVLRDRKIKITSVKERIRPQKSEVERLVCNNKKAKELLGWQPKVNLEAGLNKVIQFINENKEYYLEKEYVK
ncbi:MAG: GDP-mannose 4,6-dehydratase [Candidatus Omnitrophota bacterium]|nr:GDP-mannose 4,6-dehydratase [Candidatus Omnitrophota bacterium]